jgi:hypothetical protein
MAYGIIDFISQQTNCSNHEFFDLCHFVKHTQIIHIMNYLTYQIRANYSNHELFDLPGKCCIICLQMRVQFINM